MELTVVLVIFVALAAAAVALLGYSPGDHHLGGHGTGEMPFDWIGHYWNIWNHEQILAGEGNLLLTTTEFHPHGIHTLTMHDDPLSMVFAGLVATVTSVDVAHLVLVLFALAGNGFGGYVLVRWVVGGRLAGFTAGLLLCFCAATAWAVNTGNVQVGTLLWLCLYLLCFHRLLERGGWLYALLSAALATIATLWFFAHLVHIAIFSVVLTCFAVRRLDRRRWLQIGAAWSLIGVLMSPLAITFVTEQRSHDSSARRTAAEVRALALAEPGVPATRVTPAQLAPWFERPPLLDGTVQYGNMSGTYYFEILAILAAILWCRRRAGPWLGIGAVFLLISMGPVIRVGSAGSYSELIASIPTPYLLAYEYVPFFHRLHSPQRFFIDVCLAAAVVVGFAVQHLMTTSRPNRRVLVGVVVVAASLVELGVSWEMRTTPKPPPAPFYEWLAEEPGDFAIIEVPFNFLDIDDVYLYRQTQHQKRTFNGMLPPFFDEDPTRGLVTGNAYLRRLAQLQSEWIPARASRVYLRREPDAGDMGPGEDYGPALEELGTMGFRFLVLHPDAILDSGRAVRMPSDSALPAFLHETLGPAFYWDDDLAAYALP